MTITPTFTVGELLTKARKDAQLSQEEMAAALHVSPRSIWNWEHGKMPALDVAAAWARVTGVSLEWLASGERKRGVRLEGFEPPTV